MELKILTRISQVFAYFSIKLEHLPLMVAGVWSDDENLQLEATTQFRKLLSIERSPPIEEVIQVGVVPRFVEFLMRENFPQLQGPTLGIDLNSESTNMSLIFLVLLKWLSKSPPSPLNLELRVGVVPQVPQFRPPSVVQSAPRGDVAGTEEPKPLSSVLLAVKPTESKSPVKGTAEDPLGNARKKVQVEILLPCVDNFAI